MSFILDALKKSESERQGRSGADFASIPAGTSTPRRNFWLWLTGLLLAVNLAVLLGILLRPAPDGAPAVPAAAGTVSAPIESRAPAAPPPAPAPAASGAGDFAEQVASAREARADLPAADAMAPAPATAEPGPAEAAEPVTRVAAAPPPAERMPTIDELRLDGGLDLPELRVDLHVYSAQPADRFVFINMHKYRENARLKEGPVVREIRTDGIALEHNGRVFLLPRE